MTCWKISSKRHPELNLVLCDYCLDDVPNLKYSSDVISTYSVDECLICSGQLEKEAVN